jgi:hypothetical protein
MRCDLNGVTRNFRRCLLAMFALGLVIIVPATATAQPGAPRPTKAERAPRQLKVFHLQRASAREIMTVLRQVIDDAQLAMDERTNTVIVSAPKEALEVAEALIMKLEEAAESAPAPSVDPQVPAEPGEMRVRVVWLASGPATKPSPDGEKHESFTPPPKDLQPVVEELDKLGLGDAVMVSQSVLTASTSGTFKSQGTVWAPVAIGSPNPVPCDLSISGAGLSPDGKRIQLSVRVTIEKPHAVQRDKMVKEPLVTVETEVATPPGHFVVLGVSPAGPITSAFVVQVTPVNVSRAEKGPPTPTRSGGKR